jgi:hypothetical protein
LLVHPGREADDAGGGVGRLHGVDGVRTLGAGEVAFEQGVVVELTLGWKREDGGGDARQTVDRGTARPVGVGRPGGEHGLHAACVEVVGDVHGSP